MLSCRCCRLLPILIPIFGFLLFHPFTPGLIGPAFAQPIGEIGPEKVNAAAVERLRKMNPAEIKELDTLLEKALTLYYDRKFAQALPIFAQLADKVETMDILFWLGTSAAKVGKTELAIEEFRKMLAIDPKLYRVRLELASVYFASGRYADAEKELQTVRAANPPPQVAANIDRMKTAIDEQTRHLFWNFRLATGFMWDDNITTGPDPGLYTLPGGSAFRPAPTSAKLSDEASVTSFAANLLYDMGERRGLMWNTVFSGYLKFYTDYSAFDYTALDVSTGPWWAGRQSIWKVPVGYTETEYGSDRLSYILHVDPSYEYFFNENFSLRGAYQYRDERFYQKIRADYFDNAAHIVEIAPALYLANRRHIITALLGYDYHDAKNDAYSYTAPIAGISYFTRFPTFTELFVQYQWTQRDYDDDQLLPYAGLDRKDTRHFVTAVLSQPVFKYFNITYAFTYTKNDSNLALDEWDRTTHTISVGCQF